VNWYKGLRNFSGFFTSENGIEDCYRDYIREQAPIKCCVYLLHTYTPKKWVLPFVVADIQENKVHSLDGNMTY
jgi:hypothetical protein